MIYHYYLSANSSYGYVNMVPERSKGISNMTHAIGYPKAVMQSLCGAAIQLAKEQELRLDIIHEPLDGSIAGLILPERSSALFNTPVWLDDSCHVNNLLHTSAISEIRTDLGNAYEAFSAALKIHDRWEKIYISVTNFDILDKVAQQFIVDHIGGSTEKHSGERTDAFFGAATPDGSTDYIQNLTIDIPHRYFLKGRAGTGKSTVLRKIAEAAILSGMDAEVYNCSFDPKSLDMVVIREKGIAIFDSTLPHEHFPTRTGDEIIDLYAESVEPQTDERHVAEISYIAKQYKSHIKHATEMLAAAKTIADELDQNLQDHLDPTRSALTIESLTNKLFEK